MINMETIEELRIKKGGYRILPPEFGKMLTSKRTITDEEVEEFIGFIKLLAKVM